MNETRQFTDSSGHQWVVIPASRYLDGNYGLRILGIATQLIENGIVHIAIDLSQSRMVNSVGMSRLYQVLASCERQNGKMIFLSPNAVIAKTLRVMGMLQKTLLFESMETAIQRL